MWRAFLIAVRFLTRLPVPDPGLFSGVDLGRAAVFFPLVGLLVGLSVWGLLGLLAAIDIPDRDLAAALGLGAWVWITGGLHLDGLADMADAWIGGLGDRQRTLAIMKDPSSGPSGVVALVLVLLCKWTAIGALIIGNAVANLIWIPVLARAQLPILFATTPYARPRGLGADISAHLTRRAPWVLLAASLLAAMLFLGTAVLPTVAAGGILFLLLRRSMLKRLGGCTGDTAGALVELGETAMLVAAVLCL